jgi:hypothetical protein
VRRGDARCVETVRGDRSRARGSEIEAEARVPERAVAAAAIHGGDEVEGAQAGADAGELGRVLGVGVDEAVVDAGGVDGAHGAGAEISDCPKG